MAKDTASPAHPRSRGQLWDLLFNKFPDYRSEQGLLDVRRLARDMGRSHTALYRVVNNNQLNPQQAIALMTLSGGALTHEDLRKFVKIGDTHVEALKQFV